MQNVWNPSLIIIYNERLTQSLLIDISVGDYNPHVMDAFINIIQELINYY